MQTESEGFAVLLLDDDTEWLRVTADFLTSRGVETVDTAQTTEEADKKVETVRYDAVLADIELQQARLFGRKHERGDEWLLRQVEKIPEDAIKAAVTADPNRIEDPEALQERGIDVATKALESEDDLFERIISSAKAKSAVADNRERLGEIMVEKAAGLFLDWLRTRRDQTSMTIWLGDRRMSIEEVAAEVASDTPIGQRFLNMFIEHLRIRLGLTVPF